MPGDHLAWVGDNPVMGAAPTGSDGWSLTDLEAAVAEFDDGLRGSSASDELRAELSDRFREVAVLDPDDPGTSDCLLLTPVPVTEAG